MEEDLFKFLKQEYRPTKKSPNLKKMIEHIQDMDSYLSDFEMPKFLLDLTTKKKIKVMSRLQATLLIEENIDYLTENEKLKYKISYINSKKLNNRN